MNFLQKTATFMLAAISLAACKNEPGFDHSSDSAPGEQALMTIALAGSGSSMGKVGGTGAADLNNKVTNYTVFVFDKDGKMANHTDSPDWPAATKLPLHVTVGATLEEKNVYTSTFAAQVYVVANASGKYSEDKSVEHTGLIKKLMAVTTLAELQAVTEDYTEQATHIKNMAGDGITPNPIVLMTGQYLTTDQDPDNKTGAFKFTKKTIDNKPDVDAFAATVALDFACSKVMVPNLVVEFDPASSFGIADIEIQAPFVLSASQFSHLIKHNQATDSTKTSLIPEDFRKADVSADSAFKLKNYLSGVLTDQAPAKDWLNINTARNTFNGLLVGESPATQAAGNHFFLFENSDLDKYHPTIVVHSYKVLKAGHELENKVLYLPVAFSKGEKITTAMVEPLKHGQQYSVKMKATINDRFVGTEDPTVTLTNAAIELTITPAVWKPVIEIPKEFL